MKNSEEIDKFNLLENLKEDKETKDNSGFTFEKESFIGWETTEIKELDLCSDKNPKSTLGIMNGPKSLTKKSRFSKKDDWSKTYNPYYEFNTTWLCLFCNFQTLVLEYISQNYYC